MKISFDISEIPLFASAQKNGAKTLEINAASGTLTLSFLYDHSENPLELRSKISLGDRVAAVLRDYRIELYVNGELKDEEWPFGNRLFSAEDKIEPSINAEIRTADEQEDELPSVISSFRNAEGWHPGNGVFVGDCMPYRRGDEYHIMYLKDRHHHRSKWGYGAHQWEHISTKDFRTFNVHPTAIPIGEPWEGSICTGSWIKNGDKEFLYYTVRCEAGKPAPICRSVSDDGYHFIKDKAFGFALSNRYDTQNARDPKVIFGEDGLFHMFLTTKLVKENRGCLAHCISRDMEKWEETDEPIYISPDSHSPECPDYFQYNGKYYLVFSLCGKAHYMISDKPFEDFYIPIEPIIPCESVPKAAEWNGRLIFVGFRGIDGYAGTMTFKSATAKENGELVFSEL